MLESLQDIADRLYFAMKSIYPDFVIDEALSTERSKRAMAFRMAFVASCRSRNRYGARVWSFPEIARALGRRHHSTAITIWQDWQDARRPLDVMDLAQKVLELGGVRAVKLHPHLDGSIDAQRKLLESLGLQAREVA